MSVIKDLCPGIATLRFANQPVNALSAGIGPIRLLTDAVMARAN